MGVAVVTLELAQIHAVSAHFETIVGAIWVVFEARDLPTAETLVGGTQQAVGRTLRAVAGGLARALEAGGGTVAALLLGLHEEGPPLTQSVNAAPLRKRIATLLIARQAL